MARKARKESKAAQQKRIDGAVTEQEQRLRRFTKALDIVIGMLASAQALELGMLTGPAAGDAEHAHLTVKAWRDVGIRALELTGMCPSLSADFANAIRLCTYCQNHLELIERLAESIVAAEKIAELEAQIVSLTTEPTGKDELTQDQIDSIPF